MTFPKRYLGTALALVAAGLIYATTQAPPRPHPAVPAASAAGRIAATSVLPVTAADLLAHGDRLGLTTAQQQRLQALAAGWQRDAAAPDAEARQATEEFRRFVRETQAAGRTSLAEIRQRSEAIQQRSAALRELRQLHSTRALATLDDGQRALLDEMRATTGGTR